MRKHYQVNEIFSSIQGEGTLAGKLSTFIRLQGCLVGCPWCDTKYTWLKGGTRMSVKEILKEVEVYRNTHIVITGGEPTLYDLDTLIAPLQRRRYSIQLETSGQQWLKGIILPNWITWSPKQNLDWDAPEEYYVHANEIKWVVDEPLLENWDVVELVWNQARRRPNDPPYNVLMPEGCPPRPEMVKATLEKLEAVPKHFRHLWIYGDRLQYRIGVR